MITDEQRAQLLRPINRQRVKQRDGKGHLEGYDVRAMLTRIFDFTGWSLECVDLQLLYDRPHTLRPKPGKTEGDPGVAVAYRATMRLTVAGAVYTESAAYDSIMPVTKHADAHDMAIKSAQTQALKRCAVNLGDQFGISLYNSGSLKPLIVRVIGIERNDAADDAGAGLDSHITEPLGDEDGAQPEPEYETSTVQSEPGPSETEALATAELWRTTILAPPPSKAVPGRHYGALLKNALAEGVIGLPVADEQGNTVSIGALINAQLTRASSA